MKLTFRLEGGDELAKALSSLKDRVSRRIAREVLTDAGEPIRVSAGRKAPRGDPKAPNLGDSMAIAPARSRDGFGVAIGPTQDAYYGFFVEYGYGPGARQARPFLRPALDENAEKVIRDIGRRLWVELAGKGIVRSGVLDVDLDDAGARGSEGLGAGRFQPRRGRG